MMNDSQKVNYPIKYHWLLFAIAVMAVGFMVSRKLGLSEAGRFIVTVIPANLASFPFIKHWMPKATFLYWVTVQALTALFAWLGYFVLNALGY
jgi:hypothetical protein